MLLYPALITTPIHGDTINHLQWRPRPSFQLNPEQGGMEAAQICRLQHRKGQSQKKPVGALALPTGKFLRVWKVFARTYKMGPKSTQNIA